MPNDNWVIILFELDRIRPYEESIVGITKKVLFDYRYLYYIVIMM